jgi:ribosomal protein S18 acetylase RimI-like enzyme
VNTRLADGKIVGYCFGVKETGEIGVLAVLPAFENRGVGRALLNRMTQDFRNLGFDRLLQTLGMAAHRDVGRGSR